MFIPIILNCSTLPNSLPAHVLMGFLKTSANYQRRRQLWHSLLHQRLNDYHCNIQYQCSFNKTKEIQTQPPQRNVFVQTRQNRSSFIFSLFFFSLCVCVCVCFFFNLQYRLCHSVISHHLVDSKRARKTCFCLVVFLSAAFLFPLGWNASHIIWFTHIGCQNQTGLI